MHLSSNVLEIAQIHGRGEVNKVFKVKTKEGILILRINDVYEYSRFLKEGWCIDQAIKTGVSSPEALVIGKNNQYAYMLTRYIDGRNGTEIPSTQRTWKELGQNLAKIHRVTTRGFGESLEDMEHNTRANWEKYLDDNISALASGNEFLSTSTLSGAQAAELRRLFESLRKNEFQFGLCHGDYSLANTILTDSKLWIIDWGSASSGVIPHHDFSVILDESLSEDGNEFKALLEGYGLSIDEFITIRKDMKILQLLETVDKLRWALDKSPKRVSHHKERLKKIADSMEYYSQMHQKGIEN